MTINFKIKPFMISVIVSLIIAAVGYSIQFIWFADFFARHDIVYAYIFRTLRMTICYLIIPLVYLKQTKQSLKNLGFHFISDKRVMLALVFGIGIYLVPSYVFVKYQIFTARWGYYPVLLIISLQVMIAIMASLTDLWTRGFVLLQIDAAYGKLPAISAQNFLWFAIHIYEIVLLVPYIGYIGGIALTLFLGIMGDLLALHTRNIIGLMLGHVVLNVFIALAGVGIIVI